MMMLKNITHMKGNKLSFVGVKSVLRRFHNNSQSNHQNHRLVAQKSTMFEKAAPSLDTTHFTKAFVDAAIPIGIGLTLLTNSPPWHSRDLVSWVGWFDGFTTRQYIALAGDITSFGFFTLISAQHILLKSKATSATIAVPDALAAGKPFQYMMTYGKLGSRIMLRGAFSFLFFRECIRYCVSMTELQVACHGQKPPPVFEMMVGVSSVYTVCFGTLGMCLPGAVIGFFVVGSKKIKEEIAFLSNNSGTLIERAKFVVKPHFMDALFMRSPLIATAACSFVALTALIPNLFVPCGWLYFGTAQMASDGPMIWKYLESLV
jgi:hypothetical protein